MDKNIEELAFEVASFGFAVAVGMLAEMGAIVNGREKDEEFMRLASGITEMAYEVLEINDERIKSLLEEFYKSKDAEVQARDESEVRSN